MKLALFGELFGTNATSGDNVELPDLVRQAGGPVFIMSIPITILFVVQRAYISVPGD